MQFSGVPTWIRAPRTSKGPASEIPRILNCQWTAALHNFQKNWTLLLNQVMKKKLSALYERASAFSADFGRELELQLPTLRGLKNPRPQAEVTVPISQTFSIRFWDVSGKCAGAKLSQRRFFRFPPVLVQWHAPHCAGPAKDVKGMCTKYLVNQFLKMQGTMFVARVLQIKLATSGKKIVHTFQAWK